MPVRLSDYAVLFPDSCNNIVTCCKTPSPTSYIVHTDTFASALYITMLVIITFVLYCVIVLTYFNTLQYIVQTVFLEVYFKVPNLGEMYFKLCFNRIDYINRYNYLHESQLGGKT